MDLVMFAGEIQSISRATGEKLEIFRLTRCMTAGGQISHH